MKRYFLLFGFLILQNLTFAQELSINPVKLYFDLGSTNSTQTQTINITNNSDITQAMEIYTGDWIRNSDGSHTYFESGTQKFSCASWLEVSTNFLNIPPGQTEQIRVTLRAPESAEELKSMKWGMLYLQGSKIRELVQDNNNSLQTHINEVMRFGVHVYQTPPQLSQLSARVNNMIENPKSPGKYDLELLNEGEVMVNAHSFLELTNVSTGEEFTSEATECPIFPLGKRVVTLSLPKGLPKGQYSMLGILDYGNPNSLEAIEKVIEIK